MQFIDLKTQYSEIKDDIQKEFQKILESAAFVMGPAVDECEEKLKEFTGSKYALTCSSGTDAAVMALMTLDIGFGDEVIVPSFSFFATAEVVNLVGAKPVFVDIEDQTYNIDISKIEAAITEKTKAIMFVSLYGQTPDIDAIMAIGKKHKIPVIEDGAQSFGATYKNKKSCSIADISCTSFFPAKPLGCYGDGGAVFFNDEKYLEPMKQIRIHGQSQRYTHARIGLNARMDSLQCAVISVKLKKFDWEVEQRHRVGETYTRAFSELGSWIRPPVVAKDCGHVYGQYTLYVNDRDKFAAHMQEQGVPTSIHYPSPMHKQAPYIDLGYNLEVSERCAEHVISLPMHPYLKDEDIQKVISAVRSFPS